MPSQMEHAMETLMFTFHKYAGDKNYLMKEDLRVLMDKEFPGFLDNQKDPMAVDKIMKDLDQCRDGRVGFQSFFSLVAGLTIACNDYFVPQAISRGSLQRVLTTAASVQRYFVFPAPVRAPERLSEPEIRVHPVMARNGTCNVTFTCSAGERARHLTYTWTCPAGGAVLSTEESLLVQHRLGDEDSPVTCTATTRQQQLSQRLPQGDL
ncbi:serine-rich coiled-coil domain-containing protein 2 [Platysternon megacephalum]|uniref:Protein S100-A10 n=1 Tax=Platysternon megacephalum TaxID=55544 RepID=A0A4D9EDZ4_9SAUR|nr:serine-rich coiled-coil domain-containing protein 2 [Platysternon megacephalum]